MYPACLTLIPCLHRSDAALTGLWRKKPTWPAHRLHQVVIDSTGVAVQVLQRVAHIILCPEGVEEGPCDEPSLQDDLYQQEYRESEAHSPVVRAGLVIHPPCVTGGLLYAGGRIVETCLCESIVLCPVGAVELCASLQGHCDPLLLQGSRTHQHS